MSRRTMLFVTIIGMAVTIIGGALAIGARDTDKRYPYDSFYDEAHSVFCAIIAHSMSCVYVPRDTVR